MPAAISHHKADLFSKESHLVLADRAQILQFAIRMLAVLHQQTSTDMYLVEPVVPEAQDLEVVEVEEMADDPVQDAREVTEMEEAVVEEGNACLRMADRGRHRRSLMQRWRIIGVARITTLQPQTLLRLLMLI